jgi:acetoin utilization protein AcuC
LNTPYPQQNGKRVCIVYHEGTKDYDFGPEYELKGDRFPRYIQLLEEQGILKKENIDIYTPEPATKKDLLLVHSKEYLQNVEKIAGEQGFLAEDTPLKPSIVKAAKLIVGAALKAGELVAQKRIDIAQGVGGGLHHAGRDYGDGWCVFNDVAIVAESLIQRHGLERVMIFDTDAHAGDGTIDIFYDNPKVLYLGIHQDPETLFPYTGFIDQIGEGKGIGYTVNVTLPVGAGDECINLVLERVFEPLVKQFRPQVIIRNGGADPHFQDELADLNLSYSGLRRIGEATVEACSLVGCGLVDLICSGYNPGFEEFGLYALLSGELGLELNFVEDSPKPEYVEGSVEKTDFIINKLSQILQDYWKIV